MFIRYFMFFLILSTTTQAVTHSDQKPKNKAFHSESSKKSKTKTYSLNNPDGTTTKILIEPLPLLGNDYEAEQRVKFQGHQMSRGILKQPLTLRRVIGKVPVNANEELQKNIKLGRTETFLTTWHFKNLGRAMEHVALLPEWYKTFGLPSQIIEIEVPEGTEIYFGVTGEQITADHNTEKIIRKPGKKERKPIVKKHFTGGGAPQIIVPRKNAEGHEQLTLDNVVKQYPIKNMQANIGSFSSKNGREKIKLKIVS